MIESEFNIVYKTINIVNNKIYIGKHTQYDTSAFDGYLGSGFILKRAIEKYGQENFIREIIEFLETEQKALEKEIYWIAELSATNPNIGYNITRGGSGGDVISNHPNKMEIYRKISRNSKINTQKYWDELTEEEYLKRCESQKKENNGMFGKTGYWKDKEIPREFVEKMIETKKRNGTLSLFGENNPNFGNPWDENQKNNASKLWKDRYENGYIHPQKGIPLSEEQKGKISKSKKGKYKGEVNPFFNKQHTEETKKILSDRGKERGYIGPQEKKCEIDGKFFNSLSEASRQLKISAPTILWRIKSKNPKFSGYKYII